MYTAMFPGFEDLLQRAMSDTGRTLRDPWTTTSLLTAMWHNLDGWLNHQTCAAGLPPTTDRQCAEAMVQIAFGLSEPVDHGPRKPTNTHLAKQYRQALERVIDDLEPFNEVYNNLSNEVHASCFPTPFDLADEAIRRICFPVGIPKPIDERSVVVHLIRVAHQAKTYPSLFTVKPTPGTHPKLNAWTELQTAISIHIEPERAEKLLNATWNANDQYLRGHLDNT